VEGTLGEPGHKKKKGKKGFIEAAKGRCGKKTSNTFGKVKN